MRIDNPFRFSDSNTIEITDSNFKISFNGNDLYNIKFKILAQQDTTLINLVNEKGNSYFNSDFNQI